MHVEDWSHVLCTPSAAFPVIVPFLGSLLVSFLSFLLPSFIPSFVSPLSSFHCSMHSGQAFTSPMVGEDSPVE